MHPLQPLKVTGRRSHLVLLLFTYDWIAHVNAKFKGGFGSVQNTQWQTEGTPCLPTSIHHPGTSIKYCRLDTIVTRQRFVWGVFSVLTAPSKILQDWIYHPKLHTPTLFRITNSFTEMNSAHSLIFHALTIWIIDSGHIYHSDDCNSFLNRFSPKCLKCQSRGLTPPGPSVFCALGLGDLTGVVLLLPLCCNL